MDGAFGFTEDEWYRALLLVEPEDDARRAAAEFAGAGSDEMDYAMSQNTLVLLSIATESGREKATALRKDLQRRRYSSWAENERITGNISDEDLARRWSAHVQREDEAWEASVREVRQRLEERTGLPPG